MIYLEGQALLLMLCQTFDLYLPFNVMLLVQNTFKKLHGCRVQLWLPHARTGIRFAYSLHFQYSLIILL